MSIPSSSDAVAISALSCPPFSRVSASRRLSFDRLPWCAVTAASRAARSGTAPGARHPPGIHEHNRGAVRANQRRQPVVLLLPDLVRHHGFERRERNSGRGPCGPVPFVHDRAGSRPSGPIARVPTRKRRPPRSVSAWPRDRDGAPSIATCCKRSRLTARCAPRRLPSPVDLVHDHGADVRSISRLRSPSRRIQRFGRRHQHAAACAAWRPSACGVSPVRTAAVMRGAVDPALRPPPMPRLGSERFLWISALSALSGDT